MRLARRRQRWWSIDGRGSGEDITDVVGSADGIAWPDWCARLADGAVDLTVPTTGPLEPVDPTTFDAPVFAPSKVLGLLGNDVGRAGSSSPDDDVDFFVKAPSSVVGPSGSVRLPASAGEEARVVPECELALVIGRGGSNIALADALGHVLGYTVGLDLTLRGAGERSRRKSLPTFCPLGPALVTADELDDPNDLPVRLYVTDELVQDWSTSQMSCSVAEVVALVSRWVELVPGDVVLCGAPSVSATLEVGDVLRAEIDGIGALTMRVEG